MFIIHLALQFANWWQNGWLLTCHHTFNRTSRWHTSTICLWTGNHNAMQQHIQNVVNQYKIDLSWLIAIFKLEKIISRQKGHSIIQTWFQSSAGTELQTTTSAAKKVALWQSGCPLLCYQTSSTPEDGIVAIKGVATTMPLKEWQQLCHSPNLAFMKWGNQ